MAHAVGWISLLGLGKRAALSGSGLPQSLQSLLRFGLSRRTLENDSGHHKKVKPKRLPNWEGWTQVPKLLRTVCDADSSSTRTDSMRGVYIF